MKWLSHRVQIRAFGTVQYRFISIIAILFTFASVVLFSTPRTTSGEITAGAETGTAKQTRSDQSVHRIVFFEGDVRREVLGRLLIEASNGLLLQSDDGALHTIYSQFIERRERTTDKFRPATQEEIAERLLAEVPSGYRIYTTPHYVICYGTSRSYARWTSSLLERLHRAFTSFWEHEGFELHEPEFPLVVFVFPDRVSYQHSAQSQVGQISSGVVGYYSLQSNRVNMYDLTGTEALRGPDNRRGSLKEINRMLSKPAAVPLVSTIVHEATHQIAFNCGLQTRYADIPLWLCEGMAVVFEAPDLTSSRGWQGIGKVNYMRLATFRKNRRSWNSSRIMSLLADDKRFRNSRTAAAAYADAWALNYYLIRYCPDEYTAYLKTLADKPQLAKDDPETRLEEFRAHFGEIGDVEHDFLEKIDRLR